MDRHRSPCHAWLVRTTRILGQPANWHSCFSCGFRFDAEDVLATEVVQCDRCAAADSAGKVGEGAALSCHWKINDPGHRRKKYLRDGEHWSCGVSNSTYDTLSGHEQSMCGRRAIAHVVSVYGTSLGGGLTCRVVCAKHLEEVMAGACVASATSISPGLVYLLRK